MTDAPQQDWRLYESMTREENASWLRNLSLQDRFELYNDMFNVIWEGRQHAGDWARLEEWQWQEKLKIRAKCASAFQTLDQFRRGRALTTNSR